MLLLRLGGVSVVLLYRLLVVCFFLVSLLLCWSCVGFFVGVLLWCWWFLWIFVFGFGGAGVFGFCCGCVDRLVLALLCLAGWICVLLW